MNSAPIVASAFAHNSPYSPLPERVRTINSGSESANVSATATNTISSANGQVQPISVAGATIEPDTNIGSSTTVDISAEAAAKSQQAQEQDKQQQKQQQRIDDQVVEKLASRDREVRNHERAHAAVGGQYAGAPRYQYERGPDGVNYAVSGEVSISTGAISGDPQATIEKARIVRRSALAPAEPSGQDRKVAAQATQMEAQARVELLALEREERLQEQAVAEQRNQDKQPTTGVNSGADDVLSIHASNKANDANEQHVDNALNTDKEQPIADANRRLLSSRISAQTGSSSVALLACLRKWALDQVSEPNNVLC